MSDIDLAITRSKRLEQLLEQKLGATGKGLHLKITSVESQLSPELLRKLRFVATIRNKIVHENDYQKIDDRARFLKDSKDAERELKALGRRQLPKPLIAGILIVLALTAIVLYILIHRH